MPTYYTFDEETFYDELSDCVETFCYDVDPGEYKVQVFECEPHTHRSVAEYVVPRVMAYFDETVWDWEELSEADDEYLSDWQKLSKEDFSDVVNEVVKLMERFPPPRTLRIVKELEPVRVYVDENADWHELSEQGSE